tara:strand:+ start:5399 stop:6412 length:1014 start_codon:yes stop_codon:yes gene_type:complete
MMNPASDPPRPETIDGLRSTSDLALAMLAGVQLDLFNPLRDEPLTGEQIAESIGVDPDRLSLLLYALVSAGLLTVDDGRFANTAESGHFLASGSPDYMTDLRTEWAGEFDRKLKTAESLRTGKPQAKLDFAESPPEQIETFLRMIDGRGRPLARLLAERYDFSSTKTLLDAGGGVGGVAITITEIWPQIHATVAELPMVTPIAEKVVAEEGAGDRVSVVAADVTAEPIPGTYDVAIAKALLQTLSPDDAQAAVKNIGRSLRPGGDIYIIGSFLDVSRTAPIQSVIFNLMFINIYDVGESYTEQMHRGWLEDAGFVDIKREPPLQGARSGLMTAQKLA